MSSLAAITANCDSALPDFLHLMFLYYSSSISMVSHRGVFCFISPRSVIGSFRVFVPMLCPYITPHGFLPYFLCQISSLFFITISLPSVDPHLLRPRNVRSVIRSFISYRLALPLGTVNFSFRLTGSCRHSAGHPFHFVGISRPASIGFASGGVLSCL